MGEQLRLNPDESLVPIEGNIIIVPVAGMTHVVENSLNYAKSLGADQILLSMFRLNRDDEKKFEEKWKKWQPEVRLSYITFSLSKYHPAA